MATMTTKGNITSFKLNPVGASFNATIGGITFVTGLNNENPSVGALATFSLLKDAYLNNREVTIVHNPPRPPIKIVTNGIQSIAVG